MANRPTLNAVAKVAGVSRQTVSNVINSPEIVQEETRQRVLEAIEQTGYRLNTAARQLRTGRSHQIGLAIRPAGTGANRQVLDQFLHAVAEQAQRRDYRVVLFAVENEAAELNEYANLVENADLDGFVLTDTHPQDSRAQWLQQHGVPFVAFGRPWGEADPQHSWVDVDGAAGVDEATHHLLRLGYSSVAFLGWPQGSGSGDDRRAGWERAMTRQRTGSLLEARSENNVEDAAASARSLFASGADALVCASDTLAIGALTVARELMARGTLTAPIGLVGFDDSPVADALSLSSVSQQIHEVASGVVDLLLTQLSGDRSPSTRLITPRLIDRSTSAFSLGT